MIEITTSLLTDIEKNAANISLSHDGRVDGSIPHSKILAIAIVRLISKIQGGNMEGETFEEWLNKTDRLRADLEARAASPLPVDASERHAELEDSIAAEDAATKLVADCEFFLTREIERETMLAEKDHPDFKPPRVAIHVKARVAGVKRLAAKLKATADTMHSRIIAAMSESKAGR